jgi:hypothetical protein
VEYLVIALLEEDAKAINKEYNRIHDIWNVGIARWSR